MTVSDIFVVALVKMSLGVGKTGSDDPIYLGVVGVESTYGGVEGGGASSAWREQRVVDEAGIRLARSDDRIERVVVSRGWRDEALRDTMEDNIVLEARNTFRDQVKMSA